MKILVVGGGGREHAIIRKLKESKQVDALYCAPGNGGISKDAECFPVKATDVEGMVALAKQLAVDLVFVAPDDPLVLGMVDAMQAAGFATFGPNKAAAIIEGSKAFSKELMKKYHIPTAKYEIFHDADAAIAYIKQENQFPTVIKADGLALGKGVIIAANLEEAEQAVKHDGRQDVRRKRQHRCCRRISDRAGSFGTFLYRRQDRCSDGVLDGSQAGTRPGQGLEYWRYGNSCTESVLYKGNCRYLYGNHLPADHSGDAGRGQTIPRLSVFRLDADTEWPKGH